MHIIYLMFLSDDTLSRDRPRGCFIPSMDYARFEKLAAELDSSDESSEDEQHFGEPVAAGEAGTCGLARGGRNLRASRMTMADGKGDDDGSGVRSSSASSAAFQGVKTHCIALLEAPCAASRDAALVGIATVFASLDGVEAEGLVQFALMPVMMLLRDMEAHPPNGGMTDPLNVHKDRGIELALAAVCAIVKAGGARQDEVRTPPSVCDLLLVHF